jgi:hypothetical protein
MTAASLAYHLPVPKPDMRRVKDAAAAVGVGEATVWRWIARGFLRVEKSEPGAPRGTFVDVHEVRRVKEHPPTKPADA